MKNSSASEFNDSTSNINREYSVIDSLLKQRQVNESSIRKISTERRLSRLSSSSKKHQSQLIIPNNSGISWQMTKNLGMTVEERSHCEKKAEKFENKLFDLMKNIEQKYKHSAEKESQILSAKVEKEQNIEAFAVKKTKEYIGFENKDSGLDKIIGGNSAKIVDEDVQNIESLNNEQPHNKTLKGRLSSLKNMIEGLNEDPVCSKTPEKPQSGQNLKNESTPVTAPQNSMPQPQLIQSSTPQQHVPHLNFQTQPVANNNSKRRSEHKKSRDLKLQQIKDRLGKINNLGPISVNKQRITDRDELIDYELSDGDTSFHNKP